MHVREFPKPAPIKLKGRKQIVGKDGKPEIVDDEVDYRYYDYVGEFLWSYAKWNTEEGWDDAQIRIGDAIEAAAEGEPIKFEELGDFEKFHEANKSAQITGPNAHRLRKLQKAGKGARAPEKPVE
jgi:hypothetical protein